MGDRSPVRQLGDKSETRGRQVGDKWDRYKHEETIEKRQARFKVRRTMPERN